MPPELPGSLTQSPPPPHDRRHAQPTRTYPPSTGPPTRGGTALIPVAATPPNPAERPTLRDSEQQRASPSGVPVAELAATDRSAPPAQRERCWPLRRRSCVICHGPREYKRAYKANVLYASIRACWSRVLPPGPGAAVLAVACQSSSATATASASAANPIASTSLVASVGSSRASRSRQVP